MQIFSHFIDCEIAMGSRAAINVFQFIPSLSCLPPLSIVLCQEGGSRPQDDQHSLGCQECGESHQDDLLAGASP